MLGWMEGNVLKTQTLGTKEWQTQMKNAVFPDPKYEHCTVARITDKISAMKTKYRAACTDQKQSGFGLTEGDCSGSMNEQLENVCSNFWPLDELWGTRPNIRPRAAGDTLANNAREATIVGPTAGLHRVFAFGELGEPTKARPPWQPDTAFSLGASDGLAGCGARRQPALGNRGSRPPGRRLALGTGARPPLAVSSQRLRL